MENWKFKFKKYYYPKGNMLSDKNYFEKITHVMILLCKALPK